MVHTELVQVGDVSLKGVRVDMPDAPVLMLVGTKGFVGCGYFRTDVADRLSHAVAIVSGVSSFDDVLSATVTSISAAAAALGIEQGMSGAQAAGLLA